MPDLRQLASNGAHRRHAAEPHVPPARQVAAPKAGAQRMCVWVGAWGLGVGGEGGGGRQGGGRESGAASSWASPACRTAAMPPRCGRRSHLARLTAASRRHSHTARHSRCRGPRRGLSTCSAAVTAALSAFEGHTACVVTAGHGHRSCGCTTCSRVTAAPLSEQLPWCVEGINGLNARHAVLPLLAAEELQLQGAHPVMLFPA